MQYIAETREFQIKEKTVVSIGKFDGPSGNTCKGKNADDDHDKSGARDAFGESRRGLSRGIPV